MAEENNNVVETPANPFAQSTDIQTPDPDASVQDVQTNNNPFMYSVDANTTVQPNVDNTAFAYAETSTPGVPVEATNTFAYAQDVVQQPVDAASTFAYAQDTTSQPVDNASTFKFIDTSAPAETTQDNASFDYVEPAPVTPVEPVATGKYEPKVKFEEESRGTEETKDSYVFMIVFAIVMIAVVFALPYLASL